MIGDSNQASLATVRLALLLSCPVYSVLLLLRVQVVVVVLLHIHVKVVGDVQVHVHVVVVFKILKISVKNTDFRSEKYHLVDFLVNLLVHQPIHEHHHLDFLVNLHVQDLIHDHLQAKICHFETFKQMKN